ncbi:MAG TPA: hypothetical protein VFO55_04475 [Gemmatimonadaceae bacterium]|nr:hypothetical protein [Gemmatimonadaceae bacterium]
MSHFPSFGAATRRPVAVARALLGAAGAARAQQTKVSPDSTKRVAPATKTVPPPASKQAAVPVTKQVAAPPVTKQATPPATKQATPPATNAAPATQQAKTAAPQSKTTPPATQTKAVTPPATQTKAVTPPTTQAKTASPPAGRSAAAPPPAAKTTPPAAQQKAAPAPGSQTRAPAGGRGAAGLNVVTSDTAATGPLVIMREVFEYDRDGRRDPFLSLLATTDLRPTLSDLKLLMTVVDEPGRSVALVADAYDKKQKTVRVGSRLGRMRVTSIRADVVVFTIEEFGMNRRDSLMLRDSTKVRGR